METNTEQRAYKVIPQWSYAFARQPEILSYIDETVTSMALRPK